MNGFVIVETHYNQSARRWIFYHSIHSTPLANLSNLVQAASIPHNIDALFAHQAYSQLNSKTP
ncbi:MAG: hypothetical protein LUO95_01965 [Methylococcaceae bacterium]|nr:hypothetical protein [Methylococcaceae bacterium]